MLIRRCVYENTSKEDIPKLFPSEVLPELQKLLMLLLHKFQQEWQEDVMKDQVNYFTAYFVNVIVNSIEFFNLRLNIWTVLYADYCASIKDYDMEYGKSG